MTLVSAAELSEFLDAPDVAESAQAETVCTLASSLVCAYIDQAVELVTDDVVELTGGLACLLLPELPVVDVTQVVEDGTTLTADDYRLEKGPRGRAGILWRLGGVTWGTTVVVTYSHGWETLPDTLRSVALSVAARGLGNPSGLRQETIGRYTWIAGGADPGLYLNASDKLVLDQYRPGGRGGSR